MSIKIFRQKCLVPQCRKISQGNSFSPNYKFFDQHLQTVRNETTVQTLVFEGFLQTSIPPKISIILWKRGGFATFGSKFSSHGTESFC